MSPVRRINEDPDGLSPESGPPTVAVVRIIAPSSASRFNIGELVVCEATFSNPTSTSSPVDPVTGYTLVQPASVSCLVRTPGTSPDATPLVTLNNSTLVYSASITVAACGIYWFRFFSGAGQYQGVGESLFQVRQQRT